VSEAKLAALLGEPVAMDREVRARGDGLRDRSIPPVGHATPIDTIVDAHLLALGGLWAAAGHPNSLFALTADELVQMTRGRVAEVAE